MVQRGRMSVFPIEHYSKWSDPWYNTTVPIEEADRQIMPCSSPSRTTQLCWARGWPQMGSPSGAMRAQRAGFRCERYGDLWKLLSDRLGGHYMGVGCSQTIADGLVRTNTVLSF
jgi:hypothetical protein